MSSFHIASQRRAFMQRERGFQDRMKWPEWGATLSLLAGAAAKSTSGDDEAVPVVAYHRLRRNRCSNDDVAVAAVWVAHDFISLVFPLNGLGFEAARLIWATSSCIACGRERAHFLFRVCPFLSWRSFLPCLLPPTSSFDGIELSVIAVFALPSCQRTHSG